MRRLEVIAAAVCGLSASLAFGQAPKESSPKAFAVEQFVATKSGAKCSTLDTRTGQIYLITAERGGAANSAGGQGRSGRRGGAIVPGSFTILVVGK